MSATTTARDRLTIDVSQLPSYAFGARSVMYWGTLCHCMIEGTAMALLFASYLYVRDNFDSWPPSAPLTPIAGLLTMVALLVSLLPMWLTAKAARATNLKATQRWQALSTALGFVILALRAWEHMARRVYLAGTLPNNPDNVRTWLMHPQKVKPGNAMPELGLGDEEARHMAAYLFTLE